MLHITGRSRPLGEVGLTPRQYTEWNVVRGALALLEVPLSRGCCLKSTVLPVQGGVLTYTTECLTSQRTINNETDPRSCARAVYIAGDTLRHKPMGVSHMTVLQLHGPMAFRVLPWWLFIAGDTLHHPPMGASHMTVLQLCRLMEFCVLQWCHPMLAGQLEDKLLYPDDHLIWCSKVDSGPRISLPFLVDLLL